MDFDERKYQSALDYVYSFVDFSLVRQARLSAENFDLKRMEHLMELLGNPERQYPVIHIAGTKGKGSTAAMIAEVLQEAGYRVGLYTSPHLQDYVERIQINRVPISHATFVELLEKIKPFLAEVPEVSTFEITTAIGFLAMAEAKVDIGVIEVGLGGRLDATNVVRPLLSVITSLSYDHMNVLGNSIDQIAAEKAGIIKQGRPIVLAPQMQAAEAVVVRIAGERKSPLTEIGRDYFFTPVSHNLDGQQLIVESKAEQEKMNGYVQSGGTSDWKPVRLNLPLLGFHQAQNAATAYAALQVAAQQGIKVTDADIEAGFAKVAWAGRFEIMQRDPILVVDSAHNQDSALKLRLAMDDYLNGRSIILLFGVSEDKDIRGMLDQLMPRVDLFIATQSIHPRAMDARKLVELAQQYGKPALVSQSVEDGFSLAMANAKRDSVIVAAGSIFVAAAVREIWMEQHRQLNQESMENT
jgi:dihydrofolate synthase/folylpolyglutamate synthase